MIPLSENHLIYNNLYFEEPVFIEKLQHVQVQSIRKRLFATEAQKCTEGKGYEVGYKCIFVHICGKNCANIGYEQPRNLESTKKNKV